MNLEIRPPAPAEATGHPAIEAARAAIIDIRYGQVGLVQVRVHTTDPGAILDELTGRVATAPHFFRRTGVCLDLGSLASAPTVPEIQAVIDALRRAGMLAVGVSGDTEWLVSAAAALSLPILSSFRAGARPVPTLQPVGTDTPASMPPSVAADSMDTAAEEAFQSALIHTQPVRSGQRLYARRRDLILTASVGAGAELMADGCVHVYGALRGRVMAGVHGDAAARVFCQEFRAELISIAGVFRVFETLPADLAGAPVQAWLAGEDLRISRLA